MRLIKFVEAVIDLDSVVFAHRAKDSDGQMMVRVYVRDAEALYLYGESAEAFMAYFDPPAVAGPRLDDPDER